MELYLNPNLQCHGVQLSARKNLDLECFSAMYVKIMVYRDVLEQTARFYISVEPSTLKMAEASETVIG